MSPTGPPSRPGPPRRPGWSRPLGTLLSCLLLSACTAQQDPGLQPEQSSVDVDTPALRALKRDARVAPCRPGGDPAPVQDGLPELTLECLGGGRPVALSSLRGPLVVTLFAQWCGPCRTELPHFQRLHEQGKGTVRVLGVDYLDTQPDGALRLARRTGVTFPLLADPEGRLRSELDVTYMPTVAYVAADGTVTDVQARAFRSYADLREAVQDQLGVDVPA